MSDVTGPGRRRLVAVAGVAVAMAAAVAPCASTGPAGAFEADGLFSDPIHEEITEEALGFIRDGVFDDMVEEHAEFADDEASEYVWMHSDGCAMDETVEQVNALQADAVSELTPDDDDFDPWSASDHFGVALHPIQDFYSHSNWVELGFPAGDIPATTDVIEHIDQSDLVDFSTTLAQQGGLGRWVAPASHEVVRADGLAGDILLADSVEVLLLNPDEVGVLGISDINGDGERDHRDATVIPYPEGWTFGLLPHPTQPGVAGFVPAVDTNGTFVSFDIATEAGEHPVRVIESGHEARLLISGIGGRPIDPVIGNQCDPYMRGQDGELLSPLQFNTCQPPLSPTDSLDGIIGDDHQPDDYSCIAYYGSDFALTHGGSARSELNKDSPDAAPTRFPQARALAVLQTQYEWCRFMNLAAPTGADGMALALWVRDGASPHPPGTPCALDDGRGPAGVTVSVDSVRVVDDGDDESDAPGEINLSLAVYDAPPEFQRSVRSRSGPAPADDDGSDGPTTLTGGAVPAPVSTCVAADDHGFRVALHGWDDDDTNGDFDQQDEDDDALEGFTEPHEIAAVLAGSETTFTTTSPDLVVTYRVSRIEDADGDGLDACGEEFYGSDPADADSDGDGLDDGDEIGLGTDPAVGDSDGDGLDDGDEVASGSDPLVSDSDGDGLSDGDEGNVHGTDPTDPDSDDDGLDDGLEVDLGIDPTDDDDDDDGLLDGSDVEFVQAAVRRLPNAAFKPSSARHREVVLSALDEIEARLRVGALARALQQVDHVLSKVDGCGSTPAVDDWIIDCPAQLEIRELLLLLRANVTA